MNWFEVDKEGLAILQAGKPKYYILRELIANAWDEKIIECSVDLSCERGFVTAVVTDDSPEGFRDLRDSFTLFRDTYKRADPRKRGRFNLGEKTSIALCNYAKIETTKGTVVFDGQGRHESRAVREHGTSVTVKFKATKSEFDEILGVVKNYLPPNGIKYIVNGEVVTYRKPLKIISSTLTTEISENGVFKRTQRKTDVYIYSLNGRAYLYEMGIPVTEIECVYNIDVQQKVPLSIDRETVPQAFLKDLFAEVLNATAEDLKPDDSSQVWVRLGSEDERATKETLEKVVEKRYGEKVVVANPFDKHSIDEAISHGYNVVYGSEMSKAEWNNIKNAKLIQSSSELFGSNFVGAEYIEPDENMEKVAELAKRIAKRVLAIDIKIAFIKSEATLGAQYGGRTLTFNVSRLGRNFFDPPLSAKVIDLILHEIGHENGMHTEKSYHETLTKIAGELVIIALKDPEFFKAK